MIRCLLLLLLLGVVSTSTATPKIVWFSTLQEDLSDKSGFWKQVHDLVLAASEDLDVEFEIRYSEENFIKMTSQADQILSDPKQRPDGIIFHNYKRVGDSILRKAEEFGVKSIIFNAGLGNQDLIKLPRRDYKHWIGEILPDDKYAGAELLAQLKKAASAIHQNDSALPVIAMEGNLSSQAYLARRSGLQSVLQGDNELKFQQFFPADWSRSTASNMFSAIIKRYPDVRIMWAGNDNMALGLIDGAKQDGIEPGQAFVVGGVDWLPDALNAIREGEMAASIGGHFVEGMWALILMYDYLNGYDFAGQYGTSLRTKMLALTKNALSQYGDIAMKFDAKHLSKFDFRQLSKKHRPELKEYPFNISYLLERL